MERNYFNRLVRFGFNDNGRYGVNSIEFDGSQVGEDYPADFGFQLEGELRKHLDFSGSEYVVDSYTYSPFIDYSISDD